MILDLREEENHGLGTIFIRWNGNWAKPPIESNLINWPNHIPIFHDEPGIGGQVGKIVKSPIKWAAV